MSDDKDNEEYVQIFRKFDDHIKGLKPEDQNDLDELMEECGQYTKSLLCAIMQTGQTISQAIKTLMTMIEVLRERRHLKRRLKEENLTAILRIIIKRRLWKELERIIQKRPPTVTEALFGL